MKSYFKGKIKADTERRKQERKNEINERFSKTESKNRKFPVNNINEKRFFFLPKFNIIGKLSKSALALYPVLCSMADFDKNEWFHALKEDLVCASGLSYTQVIKAITELKDLGLLKQRKVTECKLHYYMYKVDFIRKPLIKKMKKDAFIFHTCIIDSGVWAKLKPRAKALYIALRSAAQNDLHEYCSLEYDMDYNELHELDEDIKGEWYRNRKWDMCNVPLINLCRLVNISHQNILTVIEQLEEYVLVKRYPNTFRVYLKPFFNNNIN